MSQPCSAEANPAPSSPSASALGKSGRIILILDGEILPEPQTPQPPVTSPRP
jgi:hypothetical protein